MRNSWKKRRLYKTTYDIGYNFIKWLAEVLTEYNKVAYKVIDETYYTFTYNNKEYTQGELSRLLERKCKEYVTLNWHCDDKIIDNLRDEIHDMWKMLAPVCWW